MPMYNVLVCPLNLLLNLRDLSWDASDAEAFQQCKSALAATTTLENPRDDVLLCVFTDASQTFWSAVVTQVHPEDLDNPLADQRHEPLAFISGAFKGASSRWPILKKEAFAIVETTDRLDYFFCTPMDSVCFVITEICNIYLIR
jgi:hypothetical protein